jgi:hypothetical protein
MGSEIACLLGSKSMNVVVVGFVVVGFVASVLVSVTYVYLILLLISKVGQL